MNITIIGAGAIGGWIGTRLAAAGHQVAAIARGATREALATHGWRLEQGGQLITAPAHVVADPSSLGPQDLVVIAVKAQAMGAVAAMIAPLLGPETVVLPAMNGVPWWFSQGLDALGPAPLDSIDPGGVIGWAIPLPHVIGCVVHGAATAPAPGLTRHTMGHGLILGEPDGRLSPRIDHLKAILTEAGFEASISPAIRRDVWFKLWGNMTMNPVSALTGATADLILDDPLVRGFCTAVMTEAATIGARIGCAIDQKPEDRHAVTRKLGAIKTSMLQDVEAGRPIELDAIVAAVTEIGGRVGVATPMIDALLGLTRLFARSRGLYPPVS